MKNIFLAIIATLLVISINAQTFTWTPNDSIVQDIDANGTAVLKMEQEVIGNDDTLLLKVKTIYNDIPASWDGMLCIEGLCTGMIAPVGTENFMSLIDTSKNGYVRLTINPMGNTGTVKYQVYVFDVDHPNDGDTATWILNSVNYAAIEESNLNNTSFYPIPGKDELNISSTQNIESYQLFDLNGRLMITDRELFSNTFSIDISSLLNGVYFIRLKYTDGTFATKKITKHE